MMDSKDFANIKIDTSLSIQEDNNNSTDANDETPSSGLFFSPSSNVPGRSVDITGYVVTASNEFGKLEYTDLINFYSLNDLDDVTITNPLDNQRLYYNSNTQLWTNSVLPLNADMEIQYNNTGLLASIDGITTNGTTQMNFADNSLARFGTGADLTMSHNGTDSNIISNTGNLIIQNDNVTGSTIQRLGTNTNATDFQIQDSTNATLFSINGIGETRISDTNDTEKFVVEDSGNNNILTVDTVNDDVITNLFTTAALDQDMVIYADQKASGVDGGTFTSGDWRTRDLNTTLYSKQTSAWASLNSNQITLQEGTYFIQGYATSYEVNENIAVFYNVTDDVIESTGSSEDKRTTSALKDVIVVPSEKVFEIQHQCVTTRATDGFGVAASFASNIYTRIQIVKLI